MVTLNYYITFSKNGVVIGEIEYRILVELHNHFGAAVTTSSGDVLSKSVAVPARRRMRHRRQERRFNSNARIEISLNRSTLDFPGHVHKFLATLKEFIHISWQG